MFNARTRTVGRTVFILLQRVQHATMGTANATGGVEDTIPEYSERPLIAFQFNSGTIHYKIPGITVNGAGGSKQFRARSF
jgi:hypothetical protein